jgi:hypothetical protein
MIHIADTKPDIKRARLMINARFAGSKSYTPENIDNGVWPPLLTKLGAS